MKVLINAINLSSAGGLNVAMHFMHSIEKLNEIKVVLVAPRNRGYERFEELSNVRIYLFKPLTQSYFKRLYFDYLILKRLIRKESPDVVFTMGSFAIPMKSIKQLLMFSWPYAIYPEAIKWKQLNLKQKIIQRLRLKAFKYRLRFADIVAPQTEVSKARLKRYYPNIGKLQVVPCAYTSLGGEGILTVDFSIPKDNKINLLCLARYYVHKNVEILLSVAEIFKRQKSNYRIILTMDETEHTSVKTINQSISSNHLEDYIINIGGNIPLNQIRSLYSLCQCLLLPTKLESFSATYADAMFLEKTIFTSDLDFAHEVCGEAAFYFNPDSASDIVDIIDYAFRNAEIRKQKLQLGVERVTSFPDWTKVTESYIDLISELATNSCR